MDNIAEKYFSDRTIDLTDLKTMLAGFLPKYCFHNDLIIEEAVFSVPDNSTYGFSYYEFPRAKAIVGYYNGVISKIDSVDNDIMFSELTPTISSNLSDNPANVLISVCGNGFIIQNADTARTVTLRYSYVSKSSDNVLDEFMSVFIMWYYYLYGNSKENYYFYTQKISTTKNNLLQSNRVTARKTRRHYGQIKGWQL